MSVRLAFSPDPAYVRTVRLVAAAVARKAGVADETLGEIHLAVGEACARAVALHRRHGLRESIDVSMSDGSRFVVSVTDHSPVAPGELATVTVGATKATKVAKPARSTGRRSGAVKGRTKTVAAPEAATDARGAAVATAEAPEAEAEHPAKPAHAAEPEVDEDLVAAGVGLALLTGLVSDLAVSPLSGGTGTQVRMSWPAGRRPSI